MWYFWLQFQQFCDRVAAAGFLVAAPDIFRGQPWTLDKFPPKPEDNFQGWIQSYTFEAVDKDINATVNALKAKEVTKFAMLGFCWGAAQAVQAAIAHPQTYSAVGFLHPSLFGKERELCSKMQIPLFLASASGDPYESIQEAMSGTKGASKSVYRQYNNMVHGFCSARGNFDDPEDAKAVGEVIGLLTDFLRANL
eukprot:GHRR01030284.1.p1 GENE.GHRR01030284.1~~GHRR01030284.1.p1  ORF type:complete len:195 (+),score=58.28 GHRR01030284.1:468-1052(+)